MKEIILDCETTGLMPNACGVHQLSGAILVDRKVKEVFDIKMDVFPNDKFIEGWNEAGHFSEEVIHKQQAPQEGYREFTKLLSGYVDKFNKLDKLTMYAYNSPFDDAFIRAWFKKNGDKYYGSWFWFPNICVMRQAMVHLRDQRAELENFQLITVAKHLGIEIDEKEAHDALYDVYLTVSVLEKVDPGVHIEGQDLLLNTINTEVTPEGDDDLPF